MSQAKPRLSERANGRRGLMSSRGSVRSCIYHDSWRETVETC